MHHRSAQDNRSRRTRPWWLLLLVFLGPPAATGIEVAGVDVADSLTLDGQRLALNGAGLRSRFFVKVYVGALYLRSAGQDTPGAVYAAAGPKRVVMHMLLDDLSAEKITGAWTDGFRANTPPPALATLEPRIRRFNALWPSLKGGDRVDVDVIPGQGVVVTINGTERGRVEGDDLGEAVLRIWLGDDPADGDLKRGMLGGG